MLQSGHCLFLYSYRSWSLTLKGFAMRSLFLSLLLVGNAVADEPDSEKVGYAADGRMVTPVNQQVLPIGRQVELPGLRPQALALSPDGGLMITSGKTSELIVIDPATAKVLQRVELPADTTPDAKIAGGTDNDGLLSYAGLAFSPDGKRIVFSNVGGSIKVFEVKPDHKVVALGAWKLPPANAPRRGPEVPAGLAFSTDGAKLYACGNLSNRVFELDANSGKVLRTFDVGVAPLEVVLCGGKAYVSNWGGRRPGEDDPTGPAGRGTLVRVDPVRHVASEGSVSVIDLDSGEIVVEVLTGLHASGLAVAPDGKHVVCCNANSDTLSVISTSSDTVVATLWSKASPAELLGASPNAAAFDPSGERLYVANGSHNAVAVFDFDQQDPKESTLVGMFPVGWFPGAVLVDQGRKQVAVANVKGLPRERREADIEDAPRGAEGFNAHQYHGSVSLVPFPTDEELPELSERVAANLRAPRIAEALLPPRPGQPPRAIPQRIGEPSLIKHVVYIIKENRTYDQVFGALKRGDGDPSLCIFGREITPNHHKIAQQFVLLDNTYCCGICSADGHQWTTTAYSTDYMEKSFAGFPRSYPDGMGVDEDDALAYSPAGFIWDNALAHGRSVRNYGEFMGPSVRWADAKREGEPDFTACYKAWKEGRDDVVFACWPSVESLRPISPLDYVGWEMDVPEQFRADYVLRELKQFEERGEYPRMTLICLPQDHTSGTSPGCPTPGACVSDNDLAFGRILEGLSRSKFWKEMAVFVIEDDPQGGWDHVSGYRTISFVASPYARRGAVVSTQYNTTSLIRTMEQILGLPPMNQFDASATPMFDCFTDEADLTPYVAEPAGVPIDQMNPDPTAIADPQLREDALVSASLNFREVDKAPEDVLNRILWRAMRGVNQPYPDWAITHAVDND